MSQAAPPISPTPTRKSERAPQPYSDVVYVSGPAQRPLPPDLQDRELKPGQRFPSAWDERESEADLTRSHFGAGWHGPACEITPEHAAHWQGQGYRMKLIDTLLTAKDDEAELLFLDLAYRESLVQAREREGGPRVPYLSEYLKAGREDWGRLAALIRDGFDSGTLDPARCREAAAAVGYRTPEEGEEADATEERDAALKILFRGLFSAAELVALNGEDVDLENGTVRSGGRWRELDELPLYRLEEYLGRRAPLEDGEPVFLSGKGERLTEKRVGRICESRRRTLGR